MRLNFIKIVDSGDLEGVRIGLANEMMLDPRGESFIEMRTYAEAILQNLYDRHNGELLDTNKDNWDEALLFSTKNALDDNFSKERLDYYFNLAKIVLKDKAIERRKIENRRAYSDSHSQSGEGDEKRKIRNLKNTLKQKLMKVKFARRRQGDTK